MVRPLETRPKDARHKINLPYEVQFLFAHFLCRPVVNSHGVMDSALWTRRCEKALPLEQFQSASSHWIATSSAILMPDVKGRFELEQQQDGETFCEPGFSSGFIEFGGATGLCRR
jgi:hypothetical protein